MPNTWISGTDFVAARLMVSGRQLELPDDLIDLAHEQILERRVRAGMLIDLALGHDAAEGGGSLDSRRRPS